MALNLDKGFRNVTMAVSETFKNMRGNKMSKSDFEESIQKAILDDPQISDVTASNISVNYDKSEGSRGTVHIIGSVKTKEEKERVEKIVKVNTRDETDIADELTVE
ncbi:MAG: hypothetical protein ACOC2H_06615 [Spirochaetota bacterium]